MFAYERRNHYKTRVYGDLCARVLVDTPIAIDKLKKAKKGFKFERFDSFIQIFPIPADCPDTPVRALKQGRRRIEAKIEGNRGVRGWVRNRRDPGQDGHEGRLCVLGRSEASWSRVGREADKMDRHPFVSLWPARSQSSELKICSGPFCATRRSRGSALGIGDSVSKIAKSTEIKEVFEFPSEPSAGRFSTLCARPIACRPGGQEPLCLPRIREEPIGTLDARAALSLLDAAQPLQYDPGEGWNDCSSTQDPAGRGNEEMTQ